MIKLSSFPATHVGKVRKANEDSFAYKIINDSTAVYVVCDGMGGHVGGAVASQKAVQCIVDSIEGADLANYKLAINNAFIYANEQVYAESVNNPELTGMGTTGVVLVIKDDSCYVGHVGDSRIYLMSDSQLHRLTKDHSFVQQLVDRGELKDEEAENHPMKNRILRAIGIAPDIETDVCPREIKVKSGDCFLLCSDGLNGMIQDKKIQAIMASDNTLEEKGQLLINAALDEGGKDNITAFLIHIDGSPHAESEYISYNPSLGSKDFSRTQIGGAEANSTGTKSRFTKIQKIMALATVFLGVLLAVILIIKPSGASQKLTASENSNIQGTGNAGMDKTNETTDIQKTTEAKGIQTENNTNTLTETNKKAQIKQTNSTPNANNSNSSSEYSQYKIKKGQTWPDVEREIKSKNKLYENRTMMSKLITENNIDKDNIKAGQTIKYLTAKK